MVRFSMALGAFLALTPVAEAQMKFHVTLNCLPAPHAEANLKQQGYSHLYDGWMTSERRLEQWRRGDTIVLAINSKGPNGLELHCGLARLPDGFEPVLSAFGEPS